tara:strand:- start:7053 stop:7166 length:114 start_codon:yes stop_codon:yes gene_type:complete
VLHLAKKIIVIAAIVTAFQRILFFRPAGPAHARSKFR